MEDRDLKLIEELIPQNQELADLWKEHIELELRLRSMDDRVYLSSEEQMERKRLQKLKLAGRDRMEAILAEYRAQSGQ